MGTVASLFTKSLLMGIDHATRKMEFDEIPTPEDIESLPFDEAVEYLKKRNVLSAEEYYRLSDKMKFRAFTASRIADGDILKKINSKIIQNTASGGNVTDFLKYTRDELLDCVGMGSGNFSYWETVYRTNVQTAYNAGRAMGFEEDKPLALEFVGIDDARTSDICRSLLSPKIVLPYGDPFWESHWPPLHFNCRSTVRGIYDESELPESYIQPEPLENPARGFGRFPLDTDDWWQELASQTARAKEYGIQGEIERAFEILFDEAGVNIDPNYYSSKVISEEELKEVEKIKDDMIKNKFFLEGTNKNLSLDEMDAKSAKTTYTAFENLFNKYPKMKGVLPAVKTGILNSNTYAETEIINGRKQIILNKLVFKDFEKLTELYANDVKSHLHPKGTSPLSIIYHEFAHCVTEMQNQQMSNKLRKKYKDFANFAQSEIFKLTGKTYTDIMTDVSKYAAKNQKEWIAECFAEIMESSEPSIMAQALEKFLGGKL